MLQNLDDITKDALHSFSDALAQAQQTLQQDQARLDSTAELLHALSHENNELRTRKVHNTQELQRLNALRAEKAKLTRQTQHKRANVQSCLAHMQQLKEPRLALMTEVERQRRDVMALRKHYCTRAAQVHGYVTHLLAPQNSLESLRRQLAQVQGQRQEGEAAVEQLREKLAELQREATAFRAARQSWQAEDQGGEACTAEDEKERAGKHVHSCFPCAALGGDAATEEMAKDSIRAATSRTTPLTEADKLQSLTAQRAAQQATITASQLQYTQEEAELQRCRAELKQLVLQLCGDIEGADAAQQEEQKSYHDALNTAVGVGARRTCASCHRDFLQDFS
ncbi:hypothetical protein ABB37_05970 [Leptomonas pyrrhocoris]|uniref:Uncharacterized protein n=1 Tax=Leptomonas pyrrhocoris TaxID=157538 RepID=A0A0M9FZ89_LEPPY|nr:hypothetical protein ABB37_05970 [Leptomonas pyrrhocoris]KPA78906.1 hypothetical protein ABB37_05970 [Leptomonas pyrrhocoris]|eukprot:XP_015657345.1 hypothetical protein ABB37_05970 [Leptomonas pyrrhocoris]